MHQSHAKMMGHFEPVEDEEDEEMGLSDPESRDSMESDFGNDSDDSGMRC